MKEKKPLSKGKYIALMTLTIVIFLLGFVVLIVAAIKQENYNEEVNTPLVVALSFGCFVLALVILLSNVHGAVGYEYKAKAMKIQQAGYTQIDDVWEDKIINATKAFNFSIIDNTYYYKKKLSFWKDVVHYYLRIVEYKDINETVSEEIRKYNNKNLPGINKCFILCVKTDYVTQDDLNKLLDRSKHLIATETSAFNKRYASNYVIVILDRLYNKAYIVKNKGGAMTVYNHGIKMFESLIGD